MIGNDVVDLGDDDSIVRRHHVRFDARVFAAEELERLRRSADAERLRWSMWAAKEAAFKLLSAPGAAVVFAPSRFVVRPADHDAATVEIGGTRVRIRFHATPDYVHAIALREPSAQLRSHCRADELAAAPCGAASAAVAANDGCGESPGVAARRLAVTTVARLLGEDADGLSVSRDGRVPVLLRRGRRMPGSLSLSHHGRFVAFAWTPGL